MVPDARPAASERHGDWHRDSWQGRPRPLARDSVSESAGGRRVRPSRRVRRLRNLAAAAAGASNWPRPRPVPPAAPGPARTLSRPGGQWTCQFESSSPIPGQWYPRAATGHRALESGRARRRPGQLAGSGLTLTWKYRLSSLAGAGPHPSQSHSVRRTPHCASDRDRDGPGPRPLIWKVASWYIPLQKWYIPPWLCTMVYTMV